MKEIKEPFIPEMLTDEEKLERGVLLANKILERAEIEREMMDTLNYYERQLNRLTDEIKSISDKISIASIDWDEGLEVVYNCPKEGMKTFIDSSGEPIDEAEMTIDDKKLAKYLELQLDVKK